MFWFQDLTVADPYLIVPMIQVYLTLTLGELNRSKMIGMLKKALPVIKFITVLSLPMISMLPVGNLLYISSTLFAQILITKLLKTQFMIRTLNIPK